MNATNIKTDLDYAAKQLRKAVVSNDLFFVKDAVIRALDALSRIAVELEPVSFVKRAGEWGEET